MALLPSAASAQIPAGVGFDPLSGQSLPGVRFDPLQVPNVERRDCGQARAITPVPADPRGVNPSAPNPLVGDRFFVDPTEPSVKDYVSYQRAGRTDDAAAMAKLAFAPKARWMGRFTRSAGANVTTKVRNYLNCVQVFQPGATPLIVVMRHQGTQCNPRYQAGGVAEDEASKQWYRDFAAGIGSARVVIGFEPDSIGTIQCLAKSRRQARLNMLRSGVDVLSALPNATIYLEATASDWKPASWTARTLRYIGIAKVRGFMLNVTHHDWTSNNVAYGRKVSSKVGGKPFVISTAYNGRGPVHYKLGKRGRYRRVNVYCNPRFRGLGPAPTVNTGQAKVDAYLYLNRPGVSGAGSCNGGKPAGVWWPERALMYAKYATGWVGPPRGTRFGFPQRISLCKLGAPVKGENTYSSQAPEQHCR